MEGDVTQYGSKILAVLLAILSFEAASFGGRMWGVTQGIMDLPVESRGSGPELLIATILCLFGWLVFLAAGIAAIAFWFEQAPKTPKESRSSASARRS